MQDRPAISIIVPMYKAEAFLPRCIESILAQDMAELELILVDDASPDRCLEIAREYAARDGRIRVLRADGSGAGVARNVGLDSPPAGAMSASPTPTIGSTPACTAGFLKRRGPAMRTSSSPA